MTERNPRRSGVTAKWQRTTWSRTTAQRSWHSCCSNWPNHPRSRAGRRAKYRTSTGATIQCSTTSACSAGSTTDNNTTRRPSPPGITAPYPAIWDGGSSGLWDTRSGTVWLLGSVGSTYQPLPARFALGGRRARRTEGADGDPGDEPVPMPVDQDRCIECGSIGGAGFVRVRRRGRRAGVVRPGW